MGRLIKIPDSKLFLLNFYFNVFLDHSEDFTLEMFASSNKIPTDKRTNFICEYVWNSTSFDRFIF
jgi:hypothetical protein